MSHRILSAVVLVAWSALITSVAAADDGWATPYPGHVFPLTNNQIVLKREYVRLVIGGDAQTKLTFFNPGKTDVSLTLGFPALGPCYSPEDEPCASPAKRFHTRVNGHAVPPAKQTRVKGRYKRVYVFQATFKAESETVIEHSYPFSPVGGISTGEYFYAYALATGAAWKGKIDEAVFDIVLGRLDRLSSTLVYAARLPEEFGSDSTRLRRANLLAMKTPFARQRRLLNQKIEVLMRGGPSLTVRLRFNDFDPRGDLYLQVAPPQSALDEQGYSDAAGYRDFMRLVWGDFALTGPLTNPSTASEKVSDDALYHLWLAMQGNRPPKRYAKSMGWMAPFFRNFTLGWLDPRSRAIAELLDRRRKKQPFKVFSLKPNSCAQLDGPAALRERIAGKKIGLWPDRAVVRILNVHWRETGPKAYWFHVERAQSLAQCARLTADAHSDPVGPTGWTHQQNIRLLAE